MTDGMNIPDTTACKGSACLERRDLHILSGLQIGTVAICAIKIIINQLHRVYGVVIFQLRVIGMVRVALDRMAESVETCCRSNFLRKTGRQFGIENRIFRKQAGVVQTRLMMIF